MANFLIIIAAAIPCISFFFANCCALCFQDEKEALLLFKNDLIDHSGRLSSWIPHVDCCKWEGVVCDNLTGHVTDLRLHNPGQLITENPGSRFQYINVDYSTTTLSGKINHSLLKLKHLYYLDLSYNDFGGIPIPSFIGSIQSLQYLDFSESGFGRVTHHLGNLSNLQVLGLRGAGNIDNLGWLARLSSLESLDISRVNLSNVSNWLHEISMVPSLRNLYLSKCSLHQIFHHTRSLNFSSLALLDLSSNDFKSTIPGWIFNLHRLVYLNLGGNKFHGSLPDGIGNLTSLETLDVSSNNLNSPLAQELFTIKGLVSLDLSDNYFNGPIPNNIGNNTMLRYLDISGNGFNSSIPKGLYKCKSLESLNTNGNQLEGVISSEIGNLTSLTKLDLYHNAITGIPREMIGNLCKLELLNLAFNRVKGLISEIIDGTSICSSIAMKDLYLQKNFFYGHLTEQLGEFKNLRSLMLGQNFISGPIPSSIGKLSFLEDLRLGPNKLNGTIPETFWQLSKLKTLSIGDNMLEGEVTQYQLDNLTSLTYFSAFVNHLVLKVNPNWNPIAQFTGLALGSWKLGSQFPLWLRSLKKIKTLDLSLTGISGPIPSWFWNFSSDIYLLNLSNNHLSGDISIISDMQTLECIYLSSNLFSGPLPYVPSNSVTELDLYNNSFTGDISTFLCDMVVGRVRILNLGRNLLFGKIPDCWMNWPSLTVINLANNNLTGSIPESIGHLKYLKSLDLHNNNLFGQIPLTLKNCRELLKIDLGQNYLSGNLPTLLGSSLPRLRILILRSNRFHGNLATEICFLTFLQIMDIAENNISGKIPNCFNNFSIMTGKMIVSDVDDELQRSYSTVAGFIYMDSAYLATKGNKYKYDKNLASFKSIDMSNNNFLGYIPEELTDLVELKSLNLSGNHLSGNIPKKIGQMRQLESLDLSRNLLSGEIPPSISGMSFLNFLNLSYNNLSGEIPLGTQMMTFTASSFIGNKLCGFPLTRCITSEDIPAVVVDKDEASEVDWLYISMSLGYVVGLCGVLGILLFKRSWRHAYFRLLDDVWDRLCVFIILHLKRN